MRKVEVTWGRTARVWWSYIWRSVLFSMLAGAVLGGLAGVMLGVVGKADLAPLVGGIIGYLSGILVSFLVLKKILQMKYRDFSVSLVFDDEAKQNDANKI